jgi:long-chain acyl-CoA synthetase
MLYLTRLQRFLDHSAARPNQPFLHQPVNRKWHTYTRADVEHQARCIASGLRALGYAKGSRIGIFSENCAQWFIADLAIMMAGLISVPIYPSAGRNTIEYIIEHSHIRAVFVGKLPNADRLEFAIAHHVIRIALPYTTISSQASWSSWLEAYAPLSALAKPAPRDMATIVYTSGSTGVPKGVVLSHNNLSAASTYTANALDLDGNNRCISYLSLAHITERSAIEGVAFYLGCQVYFIESSASFIDDLRYAQPHFFLSVPRLWAKLQSQILASIPGNQLRFLLRVPLLRQLVLYKLLRALGLHKARHFCSGTAPLAASLLNWYQSLDISIGEGWGMSETCGLSCGNFPVQQENLGTIGNPLACVDMRLSKQGELLIRGDSVFSHYYLDDKATARAFTQGWFHTGDVAQVDSNGAYNIIGRIKDQFKTAKGQYIVPLPIECCLASAQHIDQVCVMGSGLKQPVALIVLATTGDKHDLCLVNDLEQTLDRMNGELENHQKLACIIICAHPWTIENELLTPSLKLKRHTLESHYGALLRHKLEGKLVWETDLT